MCRACYLCLGIPCNPFVRNGPVRGGGQGGIRTLDTVARMPHFECGAFNRSATCPSRNFNYLTTGADARQSRLPPIWFALCSPTVLLLSFPSRCLADRHQRHLLPPNQPDSADHSGACESV